jgi:hypothetical protein
MIEKTISITWSTKDIEARAEETNQRKYLSDNDIYKILETMENEHNPELGITWETIDAYIWDIIYDKKVFVVQEILKTLPYGKQFYSGRGEFGMSYFQDVLAAIEPDMPKERITQIIEEYYTNILAKEV